MTRLPFVLTLAAVAAAAGILVASSAGGPPPPIYVFVGVSHSRPVAGHTFTGYTVTPTNALIAANDSIATVSCEATLNRKTLHGRQHRFYSDRLAGPSAVSCGWNIPASARGRLLVRAMTIFTADGGEFGGPSMSWRIKR